MCAVIFDNDGLILSKEGSLFYVRYDVGTHQIVMREDEVTEEEGLRIMSGPAEATKVLFELQKRLIQTGIDPYVSNLKR